MLGVDYIFSERKISCGAGYVLEDNFALRGALSKKEALCEKLESLEHKTSYFISDFQELLSKYKCSVLTEVKTTSGVKCINCNDLDVKNITKHLQDLSIKTAELRNTIHSKNYNYELVVEKKDEILSSLDGIMKYSYQEDILGNAFIKSDYMPVKIISYATLIVGSGLSFLSYKEDNSYTAGIMFNWGVLLSGISLFTIGATYFFATKIEDSFKDMYERMENMGETLFDINENLLLGEA